MPKKKTGKPLKEFKHDFVEGVEPGVTGTDADPMMLPKGDAREYEVPAGSYQTETIAYDGKRWDIYYQVPAWPDIERVKEKLMDIRMDPNDPKKMDVEVKPFTVGNDLVIRQVKRVNDLEINREWWKRRKHGLGEAIINHMLPVLYPDLLKRMSDTKARQDF